jgi:hypothetical protein
MDYAQGHEQAGYGAPPIPVFMVLERMRPMALILDTPNLSVTDVLNNGLVNNRSSKISHVKVSPLIILYLV